MVALLRFFLASRLTIVSLEYNILYIYVHQLFHGIDYYSYQLLKLAHGKMIFSDEMGFISICITIYVRLGVHACIYLSAAIELGDWSVAILIQVILALPHRKLFTKLHDLST